MSDQENELLIRRIEGEMAAADQRLKRFQMAVERIGEGQAALLKQMGLDSQQELDALIRKGGIHPDGVTLFRESLEKRGLKVPEELDQFFPRQPAGEKSLNQTKPGKRKKRVKFRL